MNVGIENSVISNTVAVWMETNGYGRLLDLGEVDKEGAMLPWHGESEEAKGKRKKPVTELGGKRCYGSHFLYRHSPIHCWASQAAANMFICGFVSSLAWKESYLIHLVTGEMASVSVQTSRADCPKRHSSRKVYGTL